MCHRTGGDGRVRGDSSAGGRRTLRRRIPSDPATPTTVSGGRAADGADQRRGLVADRGQRHRLRRWQLQQCPSARAPRPGPAKRRAATWSAYNINTGEPDGVRAGGQWSGAVGDGCLRTSPGSTSAARSPRSTGRPGTGSPPSILPSGQLVSELRAAGELRRLLRRGHEHDGVRRR